MFVSNAVAVRAVVVGAVVMGTAGFVSADKAVTLSVDGVEHSVRSFAPTVGDLLAEEGLTVGPHDELIPTAGSPVLDGSTIVLARARPVVLSIDGVDREVWTTAATVDDLVSSLGSRFESAALTASRSARIPLSGMAFSVRMPKRVIVEHDGTSTLTDSAAATVGALLAEVDVALGPADLVDTDLALAPVDGLTVQVTRVTVDRFTRREASPLKTVRRADSSMYQGESRVVAAGRKAVKRVTWEVTRHDGVVVDRERVRVLVLKDGRTRVVRYGTAARPWVSYPRTWAAIDALNWSALARCESGGWPRAVGGGGLYFGLYQFNLSTWRGVGGKGNPIDASPAEQTYRAKLLFRSRGAQPWPTCGRLLFT